MIDLFKSFRVDKYDSSGSLLEKKYCFGLKLEITTAVLVQALISTISVSIDGGEWSERLCW